MVWGTSSCITAGTRGTHLHLGRNFCLQKHSADDPEPLHSKLVFVDQISTETDQMKSGLQLHMQGNIARRNYSKQLAWNVYTVLVSRVFRLQASRKSCYSLHDFTMASKCFGGLLLVV